MNQAKYIPSNKAIKLMLLLFLTIIYTKSFTATYTVTNTLNSGPGSLQAAITSANAVFGPDSIVFNIPLSDAGYDSSAGVWTINISTPLTYVSGGYTIIDATTQTRNQGDRNPNGPEIHLKGTGSTYYGILLVSPNNVVMGFIVSGFQYGILIANTTATGNIVRDNYIGIDYDGLIPAPNNVGIAMGMNSTGSTIKNNLVSGNTMAGIAIRNSYNNTIQGNLVGTSGNGNSKVPNYYGIALDSSYNNIIGGSNSVQRNIISGNSSAGIAVNNRFSHNNTIKGNYIGVNITAGDTLPNLNGIILAGSANNVIGGNSTTEGNVISGNIQGGIVLNGSGTRLNVIKGNLIGTNAAGNNYMSNHTGIIFMSQANSNTIGGASATERNIISGNLEIGIYTEASDSNIIIGNYIGPDITGSGTFKQGDTLVQANGIEFNTVSRSNRLGGYNAGEGNVVSGNRVYGMVYYGNVSKNSVIGNYIGTDATGNAALPNTTGICVDGGSNHNPMINNVLSGNISYGLFIVTTGTFYNELKGNKIGTNAAGTDSIPNNIGLLIGGGTKYNTIGGNIPSERNIISGNRYDGIEIADIGTRFNNITGNYIGTDVTGTIAIPNHIGIGFATNPSQNTISNNLISGNNYLGMILYEHSDSNQIFGNIIGLASDSISPLSNGVSGIVLAKGSSYNVIGKENNGNIIAYNDTSGISVMDDNTLYNTISANSIYKNGLLGIDIFPWGPNTNDAGDTDTGPNEMMNSPTISVSTFDTIQHTIWITGNMNYNVQNPSGIKIELFISDTVYMGQGQGKKYLGSALCDANGNWMFCENNAVNGDIITATATDKNGNTSEFSAVKRMVVNIDEESRNKDDYFIYPNPANDMINITFTVQNASAYSINLFAANGSLIQKLDNTYYRMGTYHLPFHFIKSLAEGVYYLRFINNNQSITKKVIIKH